MNKTINMLYEIEEKAEEILRNARRNKDKMRSQLTFDQNELEQNMQAETRIRLNDYRKEMDELAMQEIEVMKKQYQDKIEGLNRQMEHHLDEMAKEIFDRLIEV